MAGPIKLDFSEKYDDQHAQRYLRKHKDGLGRRLSHLRDEQLARKALALVGEPGLVLDLPCGAGRFWPLLAEKPNRVIIGAHVLCSLCAAIAGLYLASRLRSGAPWIGSDGVYDLESIAVVVIGGTILAGGRGGIWGTMAGVMIFSLIDSIFNLAGVDAFAKQVLRGIIIVAAVAFYTIRSKRLVA